MFSCPCVPPDRAEGDPISVEHDHEQMMMMMMMPGGSLRIYDDLSKALACILQYFLRMDNFILLTSKKLARLDPRAVGLSVSQRLYLACQLTSQWQAQHMRNQSLPALG